jgi:AcrR family transcriptional regulator
VSDVATRRRGRPRDASIDAAILDATIDELIERGYLGLSMESIAARARIAKTTLYRRWPSSDDLVLESMRAFEPPADTEEPELAPGREELLFLLERMRKTWSDARYAALMRRLAADGSSHPDVYRHFRDQLLKPRLERMNRALRRAILAGVVRDGVDLASVRQMLSAPILAAALTHKDKLTRAQLAFTVDTVLAGLAPR